MKTTLKKTLALAETGTITNYNDIITAIKDLLSINIKELECVSDHLKFLRGLQFSCQEYYDNPDTFIDGFNLYDIIGIPDQFRDEGEDRTRGRYLRNIMLCLFDANSITAVRMFNHISLTQLLLIHCPDRTERKKIINDITKLLRINIDEKTSMRDFFQSMKNIFHGYWNMYDDIELMQKNIMNCCELLDMIFCKYLLRYNVNVM